MVGIYFLIKLYNKIEIYIKKLLKNYYKYVMITMYYNSNKIFGGNNT